MIQQSQEKEKKYLGKKIERKYLILPTPNKKLLRLTHRPPIKPSTAFKTSTEKEPQDANTPGCLSNGHGCNGSSPT